MQHTQISRCRTQRSTPASSMTTRTDPHTAPADTRNSYITHLVEFGYPERFVQEQVGHAYAATTAMYTWVSDDYRNRLLEASLRRRLERPADCKEWGSR
ncbi:tyrosine-type recombinase/integrase [Streptomyces sp. NPDC032472]|uniref:tyrosine-type recombinase/integrase n=1 Tax=Streptomyces sp. NPDC032472 TaxID=3155018 RepID=UPI0033C0BE8E